MQKPIEERRSCLGDKDIHNLLKGYLIESERNSMTGD